MTLSKLSQFRTSPASMQISPATMRASMFRTLSPPSPLPEHERHPARSSDPADDPALEPQSAVRPANRGGRGGGPAPRSPAAPPAPACHAPPAVLGSALRTQNPPRFPRPSPLPHVSRS